ncbi:hypothetical protein F2Q70_00015881 [Brassica cretica]|uniref:Auxin efflux carrier component n=1 Tax=Brassica cretica TaxID=69181 RepID=A0A8S9HYZ9_BRACR|nr:hypothetical protein F2Q70_00015881 [Brassica cretica]
MALFPKVDTLLKLYPQAKAVPSTSTHAAQVPILHTSTPLLNGFHLFFSTVYKLYPLWSTVKKMILWHDLYTVLTAVIPLYVAMILAYGSVLWWKIFSPDQCSGINRFVAIFAVPLLSFHFISTNNPYAMNLRFIAADTLQKVLMLALLVLWANLTRSGSLEWSITIFSLSTLPNTLVMGIPLLIAMYGEYAGSLMVQVVV